MRPRAKTVPWLRQDDELVVALNPVPADLRRLPDPAGTVQWLLEHADGSRTAPDLAAAGGLAPDTFAAALSSLAGAGLVTDGTQVAALPPAERERWRNNLGFFEAYADLDRDPVSFHERLRAARVLLLGAGGLGSMMLMNLVGLGVGEIVVVDFDRVEEANFSRQFVFRMDDTGRPKVSRAGEWVRDFSGHTTVTTVATRIGSADDVAALLDAVDLVVSAIDQPAQAPLWVNEACHRAGVPSLYGGFFFSKGRFESVWPGHSACLACLVLGEAFSLQPINRATGPSVSVVGGLMALEAVRYLTGFAPPVAAARSWIVDFTTGAVYESIQWGRSPQCPVCADPTAATEPDAELTLASRVQVGHLTIQPDGTEFLVGDLARGVFVAVPQVGAIVLESLRRGATIGEATVAASDFAGTDVNVLEFVGVLREQGLLGAGPTAADDPLPVAGRSWFARAVDRAAAALLSVPARVGYLLAFLAALAIIALDPGLRPNWESIIFLPDPALALLINVATALAMAATHEGFHWLAARRLGLPARLRVSRRGLFLVFETDLTRLWAVPRRQRYVAFLAGMAFDGTVLGGCLIARLAHQLNWITLPEALNRYLAVVALTAVVALVAQTPLFMRTDLYAVLVAALRCHNLYRVSMLVVKDRLLGLTAAERDELTESSERDRRVGRWFGGLYLIGVVGLAYLLFGLFIPTAFSLVVWSVQNVLTTAPTTVVFWEALAVSVALTAEVVWPPLHWLAGRLHPARPRTPATMTEGA